MVQWFKMPWSLCIVFFNKYIFCNATVGWPQHINKFTKVRMYQYDESESYLSLVITSLDNLREKMSTILQNEDNWIQSKIQLSVIQVSYVSIHTEMQVTNYLNVMKFHHALFVTRFQCFLFFGRF